MPRTPSGPTSLLPGRFLRSLQRDPIPFFKQLTSEFGDAVQFFIGPQKLVLFNHPDLIRDLLVTQAHSFHKSRAIHRSKIILGEGLLTSEGETHTRQRRLVQPAFHPDRIASYADVVISETVKGCARWRDGEVLDIHREMMRIALSVVSKTLFGARIEGEADEVGAALTELVDLFPRLVNPFANFLLKLPLPTTRRLKQAVERLDRTIYAIIAERRRAGDDRGDLLSMLLLASDAESGAGGMTERQLRDEVMTLFLTGLETIANALAWTFYQLARRPEVIHEIRHEIGDNPRDLGQLAHTRMVFAESMRLFPPVWAVSRYALEDVSIGGWLVTRHAFALTCLAVTHRDPRWWRDPDSFDPSRFKTPLAHPKFSYFPFGGGARGCIGEGFAWMEGVLILAKVVQAWDLTLIQHDVSPHASITLRPKNGIRLRVSRRIN